MCVALPGKVIEIKGHTALVDFNGNRVSAEAGLVDAVPGDRVLVHAGCIIQKLDANEADIMEDIFREIEEMNG